MAKGSMAKAGVLWVAIAATLSFSGCAPSADSAGDLPTPAQPTETASNSETEAATEPVTAPETTAQNATEPETTEAATTKPETTKPETTESETTKLEVQPPPFEVVSDDAKAAASTLTNDPLPIEVQAYSGDELFAAGGGGCGMSLWRADGNYADGSVLFNGIGDGPQLLMKLNGKFVTFERMDGSGEEFYGQFAQQRFRNLNGDIEVTTAVELGAEGEIESVEIDQGLVVVTRNGVSQEIAVKGDAGC